MLRRSLIMPALLATAGMATAVAAQAQQGARRVAPDRLPGYWQLANDEVEGNVPNIGRNLNAPGCAAVSYTIGANGRTLDVQARRVEPKNSDFGTIAVSLVRNFRYVPSVSNTAQEPVSTYYVVQFNMPADAAQKAALLARCALPGYSR